MPRLFVRCYNSSFTCAFKPIDSYRKALPYCGSGLRDEVHDPQRPGLGHGLGRQAAELRTIKTLINIHLRLLNLFFSIKRRLFYVFVFATQATAKRFSEFDTLRATLARTYGPGLGRDEPPT